MNSYFDLLKETFEDLEQIDLEKIQKLTENTPAFIAEMEEMAAKGKEGPEELREFLDLQIEKLSQMTGIHPDQLLAAAERAQIGERELDAIQDFKRSLKTQ